ncbi:MAG: hypothetical protein GZ088_06025 [Acidipila sp.]|nr:hypothetical protein [Acidipila sp.]
MMETPARSAELSRRRDRRLAWLTLALGFSAAAVAGARVAPLAGAGVAIGALLAWVNLRWLEQGVDAIVLLSTAQQGQPRPRISAWIYVKLFARYALIGLVVYVSVSSLAIPAVSVLGGLFALGAAAMVSGIYEVFWETR